MAAPHEALVVPPAIRKGLLPKRSLDDTATPLGAAAAKRAIAKIRHVVFVKSEFGMPGAHGKIFLAGAKKGDDPGTRALHQAALALLEDPTEAKLMAASIELLAAATPLVQRAERDLPFLAALCSLRGIADGLRVLRRSLDFSLTAGSGGWTTAVWLIEEQHDTRLDSQWLDVRHFVAAAPADEYAALVFLAKTLREGAALDKRCPLAFVFPDEPWANEDLAKHGPSTHGEYLLSATTDLALARAASPYHFATYALDLLHGLPAKDFVEIASLALPALLKKPAYGPIMKTPPRLVAQALACLRTKEAAAVLAPYASNTILSVIVIGFFRDAPELAAVAEGKGKAAVAKAVAKTAPQAHAKIGKTPAILENRPWRADPKSKRAKVEVLEGLTMLGLEAERVVLPPGTKPGPPPAYRQVTPRAMTNDELEEWRRDARESIAKDSYFSANYERVSLPGGRSELLIVPAEDALWAWNTGKAWLVGPSLGFIAEHGMAALPGFVEKDWIRSLQYSQEELFATMCFVSPRAATKLARVARTRKKLRRVALDWLEEHLAVCASGLVYDAVGPNAEARRDAEDALLALAGRGHEAAILEVAGRYGADAERIIRALLARDPLSLDVAPPKRPDFLRARELPQVLLAGGGALDDDGEDALLELLQVLPREPVYLGLEKVRDACEPESLAAFALETLEQWVLGDAPGRHEWMLYAVVHLRSEAADRRVAALAREWGQKSKDKAKRACEALAVMGSDGALSTLAHLAHTSRFAELKTYVASLVEEAASARDLTPEELADRTVPDVGLGPDGTITLSYGPRSFVVSLDETLQPVVLGAHSLPRPRKEDDAALAKTSRARFDALKADLAAAAKREPRRLERAMVDGRTWSTSDFRLRFAEHPLIRHLARRLVWAAVSSDEKRLFRVAEDGSFANVEDEAFGLEHDAHDVRVRLAHPVRDPDLLQEWPRVFGDYEILQPFEQLGREVFMIAKAERSAEALERLRGITIAPRKALGTLEARGFRHDSSTFRRSAGPLVVSVTLTPGYDFDLIADADDQTTEAPTLTDADGQPATFGVLDPVAFSELVRDVEALRR